MAAVSDGRPHPPGSYDVVVVGTGPGGLQTSYFLGRYGVNHALLSADEGPGGMFQRWPIFERLISWTRVSAPFGREAREYEWYDHNSLLADEPENRGLLPCIAADGVFFPTRAEMHAGLRTFTEQTGLVARYGCRWEATRREGDTWVLETSDGEYRARAVVFAIGVTTPWKPRMPGIDAVPHYAETGAPADYTGKRVLVVGKRNSGFEVASALLPWARSVTLLSPQAVQASILARSTVRVRYFQPLEDYARGGGSGYVLDAAVDHIERTGDGYVVHAQGTTRPGRLTLEADAVIASTGFRAPFQDLPSLGLATVAQERIPALTPWWESISLQGLYFAGNASDGAAGLSRVGTQSLSTSVVGFRYNARLLAQRLAGRSQSRSLAPEDVVPFVAHELRYGPELWAQRGYLARVVTLEPSPIDVGVQPLAHFVDEAGPAALAATIETGPDGTIVPVLYLRRAGRLREERLEPDLLHAFDSEPYRAQVSALVDLASH